MKFRLLTVWKILQVNPKFMSGEHDIRMEGDSSEPPSVGEDSENKTNCIKNIRNQSFGKISHQINVPLVEK